MSLVRTGAIREPERGSSVGAADDAVVGVCQQSGNSDPGTGGPERQILLVGQHLPFAQISGSEATRAYSETHYRYYELTGAFSSFSKEGASQ